MGKRLWTSMIGSPGDKDPCYPIRFVVARWGWISFFFHFLLFLHMSLYMVEKGRIVSKYGTPLMLSSFCYIYFSIMVVLWLKKERKKNGGFLLQVAARQMIQWSTARENCQRAIVQHSLWRRGGWYLVSWGGALCFLVMTCVFLWIFPSVWLLTLGTIGWMAALRGRIWQEEHWLGVQGIDVNFVNRQIIMCLSGYLSPLHLFHFVPYFVSGINPLHLDMILQCIFMYTWARFSRVLPSWAHLLLGQRRAFLRPFPRIHSISDLLKDLFCASPCNYLGIFNYDHDTQGGCVLQSHSDIKNGLLWAILCVSTLLSLCCLTYDWSISNFGFFGTPNG
ncbi:hypothetical protein [Pasteuria penetrans]|uniref:hypothetical protein n=1 Tax=Pasteuria penetrans TaxID=86005 RepID=UPI0011EED940|nr:hypothetical protein [Pasteuria penetrans]